MKRALLTLAAIAIVSLGYSIHTPGEACAYGGCGMKPMKPMKPLGCNGEMVAICQCDAYGNNCRWTWVCSG